MKKSDRIRRKINNYLFDHQALRMFFEHSNALLHALIAAAIFAFGFTSFITPASEEYLHIATGGVSGVSQTIALILNLMHAPEWITGNNVISIAYFVINIPIVTFAFFKIGKRFAFYTALNVGLSSLFIQLFSGSEFTLAIASSQFIQNTFLARALFAGICVGISSSICFVFDISCGGGDIVSYYLSMKKSTGAGKFSIVLNVSIISIYFILCISGNMENWADFIAIVLYSVIYQFVAGFVIDRINLRNAKMKVEIVSDYEHMADVMLAIFPHSATLSRVEGAYSHAEKTMLIMVVSSNEVRKVVRAAKSVDKHAFIMTYRIRQVYGNFFVRPVE